MELYTGISPLVPAIAAACFGVLAAVAAQLAFAQGRAADPAPLLRWIRNHPRHERTRTTA